MSTEQGGRRGRRLVAAVALLVVAGIGIGAFGSPAEAKPKPKNPIYQVWEGIFPTTTTTRPRPKTPYPMSTLLATPVTDVPTYDAPNGNRIGTTGHWYGRQLTMPVLRVMKGWAQVRLPERPNGKTAWIPTKYVAWSRSYYRILMDVGDRTLTLIKDGYPQWTAPVGMGVSKTPTPLGSFFVTTVEHDTTKGYGPFQLATSAHSEAIQSWQGMGDAIIAIHGPINKKSDQQIGSSGTYISNGCIRMHLADLDRLAPVPVGTPVDIVP